MKARVETAFGVVEQEAEMTAAALDGEDGGRAALEEALGSDGPAGPLLALVAHRDGRVTLRSQYDPHTTAAWLYELGLSLVSEYKDNRWPERAGA